MDIAILNYTTGEVDILRNVDTNFISVFFDDNVELYLEDRGYNVNCIHFMCAEAIDINDDRCC